MREMHGLRGPARKSIFSCMRAIMSHPLVVRGATDQEDMAPPHLPGTRDVSFRDEYVIRYVLVYEDDEDDWASGEVKFLHVFDAASYMG